MPPNLMLPDKGLSTVIGAENKDTAGTMIGGTVKRKLNRIRKWQRRISFYSSKERNLAYFLNELDRMGVELNLLRSILEMASYVYRMAMEKDLVRGRSTRNLITASLYVAIRHEGFPRTLKDLSQVSGIDKRQIAKNFRMLLKGLNMKMPLADPVNFIAKICTEGGLDKKVMLEAKKIMRLAQKKKLTVGKDPIGLASGAVYYACVLLDVKKTQKDIAIAADVTELTVRNRYKHLSEELRLDAHPRKIILKTPA